MTQRDLVTSHQAICGINTIENDKSEKRRTQSTKVSCAIAPVCEGASRLLARRLGNLVEYRDSYRVRSRLAENTRFAMMNTTAIYAN